MRISYIAIVSFALFAQAFSAEPKLEDTKDEAKKAFEKLMNLIDSALTKASEALNSAVAKVKQEVNNYEGKAKDALDKAFEPIKAKLNEYIATAAAMGLDITGCQSYIDEILNLPDNLLNELVACMTDQLDKAQHYVDDALNNCKQIEQSMAHFEQDIDNCNGNKFKQLKCLAKVISNIAKATEQAPQHIVEDFTKATVLISELLPIVEACFSQKLNRVQVDGLKILGEFAVCAGVPV